MKGATFQSGAASMNLNHLRAFVTVADCLSFSRAAERLHVSQPALSNQIRLLEEDLDARLFVRNRRSVNLTAAGKDILEEAEHVLVAVDELRQRVRSATSGERGTLRMGFVASATAKVVPMLTLALRKELPDVALKLKNIATTSQIDMLRRRALDIGIVRMPLGEPDISVLPVYSEPFAIVISRLHPLCSRTSLSVRDLAQEDFIGYSERQAPAFFQHWTGICRKAGFTPRIVQEVAEMPTALALVAAGVGVAILPEDIARGFGRSLRVIPLKSEHIRSEVGLAMMKVNPTPLARRFVDAVTKAGLLEERLQKRTGRRSA
jgi:DNA-binding transcriptional LysR family regulator